MKEVVIIYIIIKILSIVSIPLSNYQYHYDIVMYLEKDTIEQVNIFRFV